MSDKGYWLLLSCVASITPMVAKDAFDKWLGRILMWLSFGFALAGVHQP